MTIQKILSLITLLGFIDPVACRAETNASKLEHMNWALEHGEACKAAVFGAEDDFRYAGGEGLVVVLRHLGPDDLEEQVVIEQKGDQDASARVTRMVGESIVNQLEVMHRRNGGVSPAEACEKLRVESFRIEESERPNEALNRLKKISMSPVVHSPFVIHGDIYSVWVFTLGGQSTFDFFGMNPPDEPSPALQEWSEWVLSWAKHPDGKETRGAEERTENSRSFSAEL